MISNSRRAGLNARAQPRRTSNMNAIKFALLGLIGIIGLVLSVFSPLKIPFAESLAKAYYRYAIAGMMVLVVLLGSLIAVAVHMLDPNQFKAQIVHWVQERTQRELLLDGELKLSYFPKLGFETGRASLSQRRSTREFASVDSARVTIAWLPLLRRQVLVDRAEVDGLRAQLIRLKDGSTNIDDLLRDVATVSPANIDVDGLTLTRATLQWNDELDWQRGSLNELQLDVGRLSDGRAGPLSASVRVDAPGAGIDARVQFKSRLLFDSKAARFELAGMDVQLEGKALGVDNLSLNAKGDANGAISSRSLTLENLVLTAASKSGLSVFNARLATPELKFSEHRFSGTQLSVDVSVAHPDQTITSALQVPHFEWSEGAVRGAVANAQWSMRGAGSQWRAQWSSPLALRFEGGARLELDAVELSASASHPALAKELAGTARGKFGVNFRSQTANLSLAGSLAANDFRTEVALTDFTHPRWTADFHAAALDLDALLSPAWSARWHDQATPFDTSAWRDLNLQARLGVEQLRFGGLQASAASARIEADRATLVIEPIAAKLYGAALDASVRLGAAASPTLTAKGSLVDLDARTMLTDVARTPWLEGRSALNWELKAEGGSVGSLRNSLAGVVSLAVQGGAFGGIDLRTALREGRGDIAKRAAAQPREFNAAATTSFSDLKARFELREGYANAMGLELNTAGLRATGEGDLNLATGLLALRLQATVGRGANELSSLVGVSVPLQVQGYWRQPSFLLDFSAAHGAGVPRPGESAAESPLALVGSALQPAPGERSSAATAGR